MSEEKSISLRKGDCETIIDLIPAYVIGALDPLERTLVERLLPECPEAQAELVKYQTLGDAMLFAVPQIIPPPALGMSIAQAIAQTDSSRALPRQHSLRRWLLAAAVFLLLASNIYWLVQWQFLRDELAALEARVDNETTLLRALGSDGLNEIDFISANADESVGRLSWVTGQNTNTWIAWFVADKLPSLPDDAVYQLWLINDDSSPISAGVFRPNTTGQAALVFQINEPLSRFQAFGVTIEPAGGSEKPTSDILLQSSF